MPPFRSARHFRLLLLLLLLLPVSSVWGQRRRVPRGPRLPAGPLSAQIATLIDHPDVREAHWGISVLSLKKGLVVAAVNDEKLFIPASTAKLFPAATAISLLGSDYKYKTSVYCVGKSSTLVSSADNSNSRNKYLDTKSSECNCDLTLVGRGDPNLSGRILPFDKQTERDLGPIRVFRELAEQVAARGIREVTGNLIADDRYFVHQPYGTGWEHDDLMWLTGAQTSALAINDNVLFLSIFPSTPGAPATIQELPMAGYYQLDNRALTVPRTVPAAGGGTRRSRRSLGLGREPGSQRLMVWGEIPEGAPESSYAISIEDPPKFAAEYFRRELEAAGVAVRGQIEVKRLQPMDVEELRGEPRPPVGEAFVEAGGTLLAEHESLPLSESLRAMLKVSQNLHAEMLLRTLGKELRGVGSAEAGLAAVEEFIEKNGIAPRSVKLRDGSGLSRQNLVSPAAMTALLKHMYQFDPGAARGVAWTAMLSEAGVDGTLRNRLRGQYTTGRVWAKTGSLQGVAALAGYVRNQSDDFLAFTIFANHYNEDEGSVLTVVDNIVTALARSK